MIVLDEKTIEVRGRLVRKRRWLSGTHPELGVLTHGLTGPETVQDYWAVTPSHVFAIDGYVVGDGILS